MGSIWDKFDAAPKGGMWDEFDRQQPGDFSRGVQVGLGQTIPLAKGAVGLVGATAENVLGEGGYATKIKNWGLSGYEEGMQKLQPLQHENDDVTVAWDRAKEGDLGAMVDWAQYALGYGVAQMAETAVVGVAGAAAGSAAGGVGAAPGAIAGVVGREATKGVIRKMIEREVMRRAGENASEAAIKAATKSVASDVGAVGALTAYNVGVEAGTIYPDAVEESKKNGEDLTGSDLARVWGAALVAGGSETIPDVIGLGALTGRFKNLIPGEGRVARGAVGAAGGATLESGQEAFQTLAERVGAGQDLTSDEAKRDYINSAAMAALPGGLVGGIAGAMHRPAPRFRNVNEQLAALGQTRDIDEAISVAMAPLHESDIEDSTLGGIVSGAMGEAVDRGVQAAREDAQKESDYDRMAAERSAKIGGLNQAIEAERGQDEERVAQARAARDAEIGDLLRRGQEQQLAAETGRTPAAEVGAVGGALQTARLEGESQKQYRARLAALERAKPTEAVNAETVRSDQGQARQGGEEGQPGVQPGAVPGGGNLQQQAPEQPGHRAPGGVDLGGNEAQVTVDQRAHEAAPSPRNELPEPSEAQKEAGNYKLGHARIGGMDVSIENPEGSERKGVGPDGKPWSTTMRSHYGYVRGTIGYDKDHVDVFVKAGTRPDWHGTVYVVNQNKESGRFDEHKAMIGYGSEADARAAYLSNYEKGWDKNIRSITPAPLNFFKQWAADKSTTGPKGGPLGAITILGKRVEDMTPPALQVAARSAATARQRSIAAAELERRAAPAPKENAIDTGRPIGYTPDKRQIVRMPDGSTAEIPHRDPEEGSSIIVDTSKKEAAHAQKAPAQAAKALPAVSRTEPQAPQPSTATTGNAPSKEGAGQGAVAAPATPRAEGVHPAKGGGFQAIDDKGAILGGGEPIYPTRDLAQKTFDRWKQTGARSAPEAEKQPATAFGSTNKVFTADAAARARELLRKKLSGTSNAGLDPEVIQAGIQLAGYYIEGGARSFTLYSQRMVADLGQAVKPFLKSWYLAVRNYPGFDNKGMQSEAQIEEAENTRPVGEGAGALPAWAPEPTGWRALWRTLQVEPGKWRIAGLKNSNPISPAFSSEADAIAWADEEWKAQEERKAKAAEDLQHPIAALKKEEERQAAPKPAEQPAATERKKDSDGKPIYEKGERVEMTEGPYRGRHGVIAERNGVTTTVLGLSRAAGYGAESSRTSYHYTVKSDNGAQFFAYTDEFQPETSKPENVVPDIDVGGVRGFMSPQDVLRQVGYARSSASGMRAKAARAVKASNKLTHQNAAKLEDAKAERFQRAFDEWAAKYPHEAAAIRGEEKPKPAAAPATTTSTEASGDMPAMTLHADRKHGKTGATIHVVSLNDRVERDVYERMKARASGLGGRYSSYRGGGAIPGFEFKDLAKAREFMGQAEQPAKPAPLRPEPVEEVSAAAIRPPNKRWENDPGSIPGEPVLYLDAQDHDFDTAKAGIIEREQDGGGVLYEAMVPGGRSLGLWPTVEEAAAGAESAFPLAQLSPAAGVAAALRKAASDIEKAVGAIETQPAQAENEPKATNVRDLPADREGGAKDQGADAVRRARADEDAGRVSGDEGAGDQRGSGPSPVEVNQPGQGVVQNEPHGEGPSADGDRQPGEGSGAHGAAGVSERGSNYRIQPDDLTYEGSWKSKALANIEAIRIAKAIEQEKRPATPEEQRKLVKFVGWGASEIANGIFPDKYGSFKDGWRTLGEQLRELLSEDEYKAAQRTTQYAHYTSHAVIQSIYGAIERMGFTNGRVLEPGMGIGHFAGLMPETMARESVYTGVEYDPVPALIAKALYPRHNIVNGDYTKTEFPDNFFDMAVGNPPFSGQVRVANDPRYRKFNFALHDYFFAKTLDRVRPGGLVVFVTSAGTMNKGNDSARQFMAERANLLGAIRLPQTAFMKNAGTEVVTDVLFLQKKGDGVPDYGQKWLELKDVPAKGGETATVNEYFADHPDMVLGEHAMTGKMYGSNKNYNVEAREGESIEDAFAEAATLLPARVYQPIKGSREERAKVDIVDYSPTAQKEGNYYLKDGALFQRTMGIGKPAEVSKASERVLRDYIGMRDALKQAHYDQLTDGPWEKSLKALQKAYRAFVGKHGRVNQYKTYERTDKEGKKHEWRRYPLHLIIDDDPDWTLVAALEHENEDTGEISDSQFLSERVLKRPEPPKIETVQDAMYVQLDHDGKLDLDRIAELARVPKSQAVEVLGAAIFETPEGEWQTADEYLSGNVGLKLKQARAAAAVDKRYARNIPALEKALPKPIPPSEITARLGAPFIDPKYVEAFFKEKVGLHVKIEHNTIAGLWSVIPLGGEQSVVAQSDWGTAQRNAFDLLDHALNKHQLRVMKRDPVQDKYVFDPVATAAAADKLKKLHEAFSGWIWTDGDRAGVIADIYNDRFNNISPRQFDGSHLTLPGLSSKITLRPHQKRVVWRIIQRGNTYIAHAVGAGKTLEMVVAGMEMRRLGMVKKNQYVVPNHMLQQFAREYMQAYPTAKLLVADEKEFHTDHRRRFVAKAALSDLDAIIITQSAFKLIDTKPEFKNKLIQAMIDEMKSAMEGMEERDPSRKQIERNIETMEKRLEGELSGEKRDKNVFFEDMGVDFLFVDEAHLYRKLAFATNQGTIKGIDPNGSQYALDLYVKTRWLEEQHPGRNLVMASGTAITNTVGELYTVQRYMAEKVLEERGLKQFDAWASMFGAERTGLEQNAAGNYSPVTRFAQFVNVPELSQMFRDFADVIVNRDLGDLVPRPKLITGARQMKIAAATDTVKSYQKQLAARMAAIEARKGPPQKGDDILLSVINDGRLLAIDPRFVVPGASGENSKLNDLIDETVRLYKETAGWTYSDSDGKVEPVKGAAQVIFSDLGFGEQVAASRGFDASGWLMKRFAAAGIRPEQVAFMSDYKKSGEKLKLFQAVNSGRVRIVIGSSKNMGVGTNIQRRLYWEHHLDAPWYPADMEQREGRILRQGNQNPEIGISAYATKGTYDSTMFQMNATKSRFIEQLMTGDATLRTMADVSEASQYEMAQAISSGDERVIRLAGLKADLEGLNRLFAGFIDDQNKLRRRVSDSEFYRDHAKRRIEGLNKDLAVAQPYLDSHQLDATVEGKHFDKPKELGEAIIAALKARGEKVWEGKEIVGKVNGFEIELHGIIERDKKDRAMAYSLGAYMKFASGAITLVSYNDIADASAVGTAMKATNHIAGLPRTLANEEASVSSYEESAKVAKSRLGGQFEYLQKMEDTRREIDTIEDALKAESAAAKAAAMPVTPAPAPTEAPTIADDKPLFNEGEDEGNVGDGAFLRSSTEKGLGREAVQKIVDRVLERWQNAPAVRVLGSMDDAPQAMKDLDAAQRAAGATGRPAAFIHRGVVYLLADSIESPVEVYRSLFHEILGHYGLRGAFGETLNPILDQVAASMPGRVRAKARQYGMDFGNVDERRQAAEEVLTEMAETMPRSGFVRRAIAAIRSFLRSLGLDIALSDSDIIANYILPARGYVERGGTQGALRPAPAFSRGAERGEDYEAMERYLAKQAKRLGFKNTDELARKDPEKLGNLAADWREEHPAGSMFQRAAIAGGPTVGDQRDAISSSASRWVRDLLHNDSKFNWWHRSIGTQQHKALTNADFKKAYDESQAFLADVNKYANEAADNAQSLLPRIEGFGDFFKKSASKTDIDAVTKALYAGTLFGGGSPLQGRAWSDEELRRGRALQNMGGGQLPVFVGLTDKQIELYRQARASVDKSLDELGKSLIHRVVRVHGLGIDRGMGLADVAQDVRDQIDEAIAERQLQIEQARDAGDDATLRQVQGEVEQLHNLTAQVNDLEQKTAQLKERGYFPAMRFGQYAVHVTRENADGEPEQLFFGLYESQTAANLAAREIERDPEFEGATITRGLISKEQHRLFQGMSLDALETFADYITGEDGQPISKDPLVQGFLKAAVAERSSLKRHIHRKGLAGYSDDLPRVLASFTVSSARTTSANYHNAEMLRLASEIRAGDVKDEAIKLVRYLLDPQEEAQAIRGFLFAQFLGGSIAHGLVNMTQPFMVTIPYLSQHTSAADAASKVAAAATTRPEKLTGRIADAYARAKKEGVVAPQEIHQLRAETGGLPLAKNLVLRKISFLWGSIYAVTEQFNRSTAFIAAYRIAEAKRIPNPYAFAREAVEQTQFVYNKGNRPNWARGAFGATVFTFKQFSISYLELAKRLFAKDKKAFALMALALLAGAGAQGLPFAEDLEDLIDTIGQWMGFATNSKKALRKWATNLLGPDLAQVALHGISGLPWMPVDVSVRLGLQNLIPGTAMLKLSEKNKAQDVLELVGPIGQFVPAEGTMMGRALERLSKSDYMGALRAGAPVAIQNAAKGAEMLATGEARDSRGKKVTTVSPAEAVFKMAGLQPAKVARESERIGEVMQDVDMQKRMEDEIAEQWARGIVDKEPEQVREAMKKLHDWNHDNPELRVRINMTQIRQRVKNMRTPREDRIVKSAPPEIRARVRESLRQ